MAMEFCPKCQKEIPAGSVRCEYCSTDVASTAPDKSFQSGRLIKLNRWMRWLLIVIIAYVVGEMIIDPAIRCTVGLADLLGLSLPFLVPTALLTHAFAFFRYRKTTDKGPARNSLLLLLAILMAGTGALVPAISYVHKYNSPDFCPNHLKYIGIIVDMYAAENNGLFPPIDDFKNNFIFEGDAVYPNYLTDVNMLACPEDPELDRDRNLRLSSDKPAGAKAGEFHPDCITDMSYCYFGWIIMNQQEAEAFFEAYDKMVPEDYDEDIIVPQGRGNGGGNVIYRLRSAETLPPHLNLDPAKVPVVWDKPSADISELSHVPAGCNVLYLDGHVEFIRYQKQPDTSPFPVNPEFAQQLEERPRAPIPDCEE